MGIYIKEMEMPGACCACPCSYDNLCAVTKQYPTFNEWYEDRPKWCPLIPVPPHGDLIDRYALERDIDKYIGGEESRSRFHHWVQVQSVVIPGDKGEET